MLLTCMLLDTSPKSSSINSINLVKKSATIPEREFFLGDCFLLAHPVYGFGLKGVIHN